MNCDQIEISAASGIKERQSVSLKWLDPGHASGLTAGVTWGVPWHRGQLARDEPLELLDEQGLQQPVQSWPLAYWPDGSVKWTAHAAQLPNYGQERFTLRKAAKQAAASASFVSEDDQYISIHSDVLACKIAKQGDILVTSLALNLAATQSDSTARPIAQRGRLKLHVADLSGAAAGSSRHTASKQEYTGHIEQACIENAGPLRAVIVIKGRHMPIGEKLQIGSAGLIPFTVRLIFYRSSATIGLKHTLFYDGDPAQHAIAAVGICFDLPMQGELYNRHIRFAGDTGWFSEAARGLMTARLPDYIRDSYKRQLQGEFVAWGQADEQVQRYRKLLDDAAIWNDFKLVQLSPDSYKISKRTSEQAAWIRALYGARARGMMYAGSEAGGIAFGLKHFWQQCPSGFEVRGLGSEQAEATLWLWSPDGEPMDLRHYDTVTHVLSSYEGDDELRSTPYGIAHTSDCILHLAGQTPSLAELEQLARVCEYTPLLVCQPERYAASSVFGRYSLPDCSTAGHRELEDTLEQLWCFYRDEVEQRKWYGFWDYGDVMHSYDPVRHTWKYDIGGCAWQNTELVPNKWLWYSFLRTGQSELFYMAEAMTRHTSETDLYHFGPYQGLGSRHNVLHFGCGCKEARIGMATLHRFYFYLTADERVGEIMDEVKDADYATVALDPMRAYFPKDEFPTHARSGPDWSAFCANWLVQWERYESQHYLDKIKAGIESLKRSPHRLLGGPTYGYNPETGELSYIGHENYDYHMIICMGGPQVWIELADLLEDEEWADMLAELGEFYNLSAKEKSKRTNGAIVGKRWSIPMLSTLLMAYAAQRTGNKELGKQAWSYLTTVTDHWQISRLMPQQAPILEYPHKVVEVEGLSTNTASQWSLNVLMCKAYIGELLQGASL